MRKYYDALKEHLKRHHETLKQHSRRFIYHVDFHRKRIYEHGRKIAKKTSFKEIYKEWYAQVAEVKTQPHEIAFGLALGIFLGIVPALGLHILFALLIIAIFRVNKVALFIGLALTNPLVTPLIYSASLKIGGLILNTPRIEISFNLITWSYIKHYIKPFLIGNIILATTVSFLSYTITYYLVKYYKNKILIKIRDDKIKNDESNKKKGV
ncbi:DUF2062 domain-containing protein [Candidatus Woesearchaeota archaeon]|nr:DUF2062 domain-containing protein [Candidatus Woesearchaeota archaeon]